MATDDVVFFEYDWASPQVEIVPLVNNTKYYVRTIDANTIELSLTPAGAKIVLTAGPNVATTYSLRRSLTQLSLTQGGAAIAITDGTDSGTQSHYLELV